MKTIAAYFALTSLAAAYQPAVYPCVPTQCCPPQCGPPECGPQWYAPPRRAPQQPDPQYEIRQPEPTPPQQPQPTIDATEWQQWIKEQSEQQQRENEQQEKSLILLNEIKLAVTTQHVCQCQPTDLAPVLSKLDEVLTACSAPPPVVAPPPEPAAEEHVVIVADHNAPYWQRLAEAIANTKKTYSGVQDTTLPNFPIGVHPQAVVYRNSVPVRIVKGQYDVEALLSRLARGEPI